MAGRRSSTSRTSTPPSSMQGGCRMDSCGCTEHPSFFTTSTATSTNFQVSGSHEAIRVMSGCCRRVSWGWQSARKRVTLAVGRGQLRSGHCVDCGVRGSGKIGPGEISRAGLSRCRFSPAQERGASDVRPLFAFAPTGVAMAGVGYSLPHDVFGLHAISLSFAHKFSRSCVAMLDVAFRTSALRLSRLCHDHIPRKALPRKAKVRPWRALVHDAF
jgi:hypothetical protein